MKNNIVQIKKILLVPLLLIANAAIAAPFGNEEDVAYSNTLWRALESSGFVGSNGIMSTPYDGQPPHGKVLDTIEGKITLPGEKTSHVIIKRNYGGEGVSKQAVANDPPKYLKAVTVMYKRPGFDADNKDWFWVKYKADGTLHANPKGMSLAGAVAKGMPKGCIACHKAAPGGDYVFNHDRLK